MLLLCGCGWVMVFVDGVVECLLLLVGVVMVVV
jgi:hypothetical protein